MNPDDRPISEWMQPIRPLRVLFKTSEEDRHHVYILAVRTIGEQMEYLTIDGIFINALSRSVMYAETMLVENKWTRLG
jgi:hypothetical protein